MPKKPKLDIEAVIKDSELNESLICHIDSLNEFNDPSDCKNYLKIEEISHYTNQILETISKIKRLTKSISQITKKYECYTEENELYIKVKPFKFNYYNLSFKYEDISLILNLGQDFDRFRLESDYIHPHYDGEFCYGEAHDIVYKLLENQRHDIAVDVIIDKVIKGINIDSMFFEFGDMEFSDEELDKLEKLEADPEKSNCYFCGKTVNIKTGVHELIEEQNKYFHKRCHLTWKN